MRRVKACTRPQSKVEWPSSSARAPGGPGTAGDWRQMGTSSPSGFVPDNSASTAWTCHDAARAENAVWQHSLTNSLHTPPIDNRGVIVEQDQFLFPAGP